MKVLPDFYCETCVINARDYIYDNSSTFSSDVGILCETDEIYKTHVGVKEGGKFYTFYFAYPNKNVLDRGKLCGLVRFYITQKRIIQDDTDIPIPNFFDIVIENFNIGYDRIFILENKDGNVPSIDNIKGFDKRKNKAVLIFPEENRIVRLHKVNGNFIVDDSATSELHK